MKSVQLRNTTDMKTDHCMTGMTWPNKTVVPGKLVPDPDHVAVLIAPMEHWRSDSGRATTLTRNTNAKNSSLR